MNFSFEKEELYEENRRIYREIISILNKYNIDLVILEECLKQVTERKQRVLAHLYIILDRYSDSESENETYKIKTKRFIKDLYYNQDTFVKEAQTFIEKLLRNNKIDYSYDPNRLDEYAIMIRNTYNDTENIVNVVAEEEDRIRREKEALQKLNKVPQVDKIGFKERQNISTAETKSHVSYKHILEMFSVSSDNQMKINKLFTEFSQNEKFVNKDMYYMYAIHLVTGIKLSTIKIKMVEKRYNSSKMFTFDKNNTVDKVSETIMTKFSTFFKYSDKDEYDEYKKRHEYNSYIKITFNENFIKKYIDIDKLRTVTTSLEFKPLAITVVSSKIKGINIVGILENIQKYIVRFETVSRTFYNLNDNIYNDIQVLIQDSVKTKKFNNKVRLIEYLFSVLTDMKKNKIIENIKIYYYE